MRSAGRGDDRLVAREKAWSVRVGGEGGLGGGFEGGGMGWVSRLGVFNVVLRDIDGV